MNALMQFTTQLMVVVVATLLGIQISLMMGYYWVATINALLLMIVGLGACLQYMSKSRR